MSALPPSTALHNRTVRSTEPETMWSPHATRAVTVPVWRYSVWTRIEGSMGLPFLGSQTFMQRSALPVSSSGIVNCVVGCRQQMQFTVPWMPKETQHSPCSRGTEQHTQVFILTAWDPTSLWELCRQYNMSTSLLLGRFRSQNITSPSCIPT